MDLANSGPVGSATTSTAGRRSGAAGEERKMTDYVLPSKPLDFSFMKIQTVQRK